MIHFITKQNLHFLDIYQSGIKETDFLLAIDKKVSAQNGFTV